MSTTADLMLPAATPTTLGDVLAGRRLLWHIPGFATPEYCASTVNAVRSVEFSPYPATVDVPGAAPVLKVGPTIFDHFGTDFADYFAEAAACDRRLRSCFAAAEVRDPWTFLLELLSLLWDGPVAIAEEDGRPYFAGVLRSIPGGTLPHVDNASVETPALAIGKTTAQGTILLYLAMPSSGGATKVFAKRPSATDPTYSWGYAPEAVAGTAFAGVTPAVGDVVLFPTTHIHQVEPATGAGDRITVSAFYGPDEDGRLVVWS